MIFAIGWRNRERARQPPRSLCKSLESSRSVAHTSREQADDFLEVPVVRQDARKRVIPFEAAAEEAGVSADRDFESGVQAGERLSEDGVMPAIAVRFEDRVQ